MSLQSALFVVEIGKPLEKAPRPIAVPTEDCVLVKVLVAGIIPVNQKQRETGLFIADHLPAILTCDIVGIVEACGPKATKYKVGDTIIAQSNPERGPDAGGLQQHAIIDEGASTLLPKGINPDDAATMLTNLFSVMVPLFHSSGLGLPFPEIPNLEKFDYASNTLVIVGGGADCGKFGVQVASYANFGKIIVIASMTSELLLKSMGATHVLDRYASNAELKKQLDVLTGTDGVLYVFDTVNRDHSLAISLLSGTQRGKVAGLLPDTDTIASNIIGEKKAGYDVVFTTGSATLHFESLGRVFFEKLGPWMESGVFKPTGYKIVEGGLSVDGVNKVFDAYRDGKNPGRFHVHPNTMNVKV